MLKNLANCSSKHLNEKFSASKLHYKIINQSNIESVYSDTSEKEDSSKCVRKKEDCSKCVRRRNH